MFAERIIENVMITRNVIIMSDIRLIVSNLKVSLMELSKQTALLGNGLLNAAPGDKQGGPNPSVQYLLATADNLKALVDTCETIAQHGQINEH